jgi:uncharacterized membrane protein
MRPMRLLLALAGPVYVAAGLLHFLKPRIYERIMPPWLPAHRALVYASGVAEMAGGAALLAPSRGVRRFGGRFMTATLVAIFPANVHMALNPDEYRGIPGGRPALYARLPFQALFIAWALASGNRR